MEIITRLNQSVLDIALIAGGTIECAFEIAEQNGLSITDMVLPNTTLVVAPDTVNEDVRAYYEKNKIVPATVRANEVFTGIGYWEIGNDFKVS